MSTFRVFCGFDGRQAEAAEVFAFSVRTNSTISEQAEWLWYLKHEKGKVWPRPAFSEEEWFPVTMNRTGVTQFSYSRFLCPHLMDFSGRACFFDACDQLCLGDVAELADFDMQGKPVCVVKHPPIRPGMKRARSWSSVMLMDCAQLTWLTPSFVETAADSDLMLFARLRDDEIGDLPPEWNFLLEPRSAGHIEVTLPSDMQRTSIPGLKEFPEPPLGTKLAHWSALSNPNMGNWIDASGSRLWAEWRARWRAANR